MTGPGIVTWVQGILDGAPIWVWPLLGLLLVIGLITSRPHQAPVILYYFLPLSGLISLNAIASLPFQAIAWTGFGAGYVVGAIGAHALQGKWLLGRQGGVVSLAGEWFTMLVLMVIFWMNFAGGMMQVVSPQTYSTQTFIALFASLVGAASGSFLGQAVKIISYRPV